MRELLGNKVFKNEIHANINHSTILWKREIKDTIIEERMEKAMNSREDFLLLMRTLKENSKLHQKKYKRNSIRRNEQSK